MAIYLNLSVWILDKVTLVILNAKKVVTVLISKLPSAYQTTVAIFYEIIIII